MYYKKIKGNRLYLSPMDLPNEISLVTKWFNEDEDIAFGNGFYSSVLAQDNVEEMLKTWKDSGLEFSIIDLQTDKLIGHINLFGIDKYYNSATMSIYLSKDYRNQGLGQEAISLLLDYSFKYQPFKAIHLEVYSFNKRAIAVYQKCGFKECGCFHQCKYHEGKYHDIIMMEILKTDYFNKN